MRDLQYREEFALKREIDAILYNITVQRSLNFIRTKTALALNNGIIMYLFLIILVYIFWGYHVFLQQHSILNCFRVD